jgi:hypothetical protein
MVWISGFCRCGFGPRAWLWQSSPGELPGYPVSRAARDEAKMLETPLYFLDGQLEQLRKRLEVLKR